MYFPFLRGRQYELLALRDLVAQNLIGDRVVPVIEPVKLSNTLIKTANEYLQQEHELAVILNPTVGSFTTNMLDDDEGSSNKANIEDFLHIFDNRSIIKSIIMQPNTVSVLDNWLKHGVQEKDLLVVNTSHDHLDAYSRIFDDSHPRYTLIPDESAFRRRAHNRVILSDKFSKQSRNSDYKYAEDEFFSEDHLFYKDDQFIGFSDYSVIGSDYQESGFAPYAVAIHIVYFAENKSLRIKHFVSDSNDDISNPAKKFYEAVAKLYSWYQSTPMYHTKGLETLISHYHDQSYPGLGVVKKLSVMHHLELMSNYLSKG